MSKPRTGITYSHGFTYGSSTCKPQYSAAETRRRAGARVCPKCGAELYARTVTFAVLPWRADGRYDVADAIATYSTEKAADERASALYAADPASPYVSRTLSVA